MTKPLNDVGLPDPEYRMLLLIAGFLAVRGRSPSLRELADTYGCTRVFALTLSRRLEKKELIARENGIAVSAAGARDLLAPK